jgi:hypothetical protein
MNSTNYALRCLLDSLVGRSIIASRWRSKHGTGWQLCRGVFEQSLRATPLPALCACTGDAMDTGSSQQHVLGTVLHWRDVLDRAVSVARLLTGQRHSTCLRTAIQLCQFIQHLTARRSSSCR